MDWTKIIEIIALIRHIIGDIQGELVDEDPGVIDFDDLVTLLTEKDLGGDVLKIVQLIMSMVATMSDGDRLAARRLLLDLTDDLS